MKLLNHLWNNKIDTVFALGSLTLLIIYLSNGTNISIFLWLIFPYIGRSIYGKLQLINRVQKLEHILKEKGIDIYNI